MEDDCKITNDCVNCPIVKKKLEAIELELIQKKVWFNEEEVTAYTGISRNKIRDLRFEGSPVPGVGTLPFCRVGRNILYKRSDVDKFLLLHEVKALR